MFECLRDLRLSIRHPLPEPGDVDMRSAIPLEQSLRFTPLRCFGQARMRLSLGLLVEQYVSEFLLPRSGPALVRFTVSRYTITVIQCCTRPLTFRY